MEQGNIPSILAIDLCVFSSSSPSLSALPTNDSDRPIFFYPFSSPPNFLEAINISGLTGASSVLSLGLTVWQATSA
jgi:hypothetical protein